jgi:beta-carotene hydroxylase
MLPNVMLRNRGDLRTVAYLAITVVLFVYQWQYEGLFNPWLYPLTLFMSFSTAVISHNQNHVSMWRSRPLNLVANYLIGIFYGHPAIGWVPTHNLNHHKLNNRDGDLSICPRWFKGNHLLSLLIYPTITSLAQTAAIRGYMRELRARNRRLYWEAVSEYVVFFGLMAVAFLVDWRKAIFLLLIPQQVALFSIQAVNFFQHVECDKDSEWNHSRNFTGPVINALLFNNGYHTVHHEKPGVHWSALPRLHAQHAAKIGTECIEPSWPRWFARVYLIRPFRRLRPA